MNKKKDIFNSQILTFTHKFKKKLLFLDKPWLITPLVVNLFRISEKFRAY
jgi:IMP dehydrogenase